jgi:hypothetical protein
MNRVCSLSGFLDGCSEFLEVRLFEMMELLLVGKGLSLILNMDDIDGVLAFSEGLGLVFVVVLHLDLLDIGENLLVSLDEKLGISELLVEGLD